MTPNLEVIVDYIKANHPGYTHLGITNCRPIADSQTYSQHSWSNAVDVHCSEAYGDALVADLKAVFEPHLYEVLWQVEGHFDHVHVSTWPKGWLTPPCAGGAQRIKYEDGTVVNGPFPLTIKEEDMPLSDEDVTKVADAVIARVGQAVWFHLVTHPVTGVQRGAQALLADAVRYAHTAAFRPFSAAGATVKQIVDGIKAQWAK